MSKAMEPLKELMEKTKRVRIIGEGTDLEFSIEGIGVLKGMVRIISRMAKYIRHLSKIQ